MAEPRNNRPDPMRYASLGMEFIAAFGLMLFLGYLVDRHYGTLPAFTLVGAGVGFAAGMYRLIRRAKELQDAGGPKGPGHRS